MADVAASKAEGRLRLDMPKPDTIADGLAGRMGDLTWPVVRDLVDAVVTVRARGAGGHRGAGWGRAQRLRCSHMLSSGAMVPVSGACYPYGNAVAL